MKSFRFVCLALALVAITVRADDRCYERQGPHSRQGLGFVDGVDCDRVRGALTRGLALSPVRFEENRGQRSDQVEFFARGRDYDLLLLSQEFVVGLDGSRTSASGERWLGVSMRPAYADPSAAVVGAQVLPGKVNYLFGNDPTNWIVDVPTFAAVRYQGVYQGIDLVFHGDRGRPEFDFVVSPGADPRHILLDVEALRSSGVEAIVRESCAAEIEQNGDLLVSVGGQEIRWKKPLVYQDIAGVRRLVSGEFVCAPGNRVGFRVGEYDPSVALVIDPVLVSSTYLGGGRRDIGTGIAVDAADSAYVIGSVRSENFPLVAPFQDVIAGAGDCFVTKYNPLGTAIVFSTYFGGSGEDSPRDIAVDAAGGVYIAGSTASNDFPTMNAFQPERRSAQEGFISKLDPDGSALIYSTYLGGAEGDTVNAIALDPAGNLYACGSTRSRDFPVSATAFQPERNPSEEGFVSKLDPTGMVLVYSTYLGGRQAESILDIAVDDTGIAYVTGGTRSKNFPTTPNAFQPERFRNQDCFVTVFDANGEELIYSSYLGGRRDEAGSDIALDTLGHAYVVGVTQSANFPTENAFQNSKRQGTDAFLTKLAPDGSALIYSTYIGGGDDDAATGLAVDVDGNVFMSGNTRARNFPRVAPIQAEPQGQDLFVLKMLASGDELQYSTYLGGRSADTSAGIAIDATGNAYLTGVTRSIDFPLARPAQGFIRGSSNPQDSFLVKISPETAQDLAANRLTAPKRANLTKRKPSTTQQIKVRIQNRGLEVEVIPDLQTLDDMITVTVASLGDCPDPIPTIIPPNKSFPIVLRSKGNLNVRYEVVLDCANDPTRSTNRDPGHEDYNVIVQIDRSAIDGNPDDHLSDDFCPRGSLPEVIDANPDGSIRDRGCGRKNPDATFGADVLIDVVVK